jgi:hypothetical protein
MHLNEHGGNLTAEHVRLPIPHQRPAVLPLRAVAGTERGEALDRLNIFRRDVVRKTAKGEYISFVKSVCPSVSIEELCSHLTDFH